MPATARAPGYGIRPWNGQPGDLDRVGAEYRRAMQGKYKGNLAQMWGAYNWGPGNMDRAISLHGDNWLSAAPPETQDYIARNLKAVGLGGN